MHRRKLQEEVCLKEEIKFAREIDGGNGVFKRREKPIGKRFDSLAMSSVIFESSLVP